MYDKVFLHTSKPKICLVMYGILFLQLHEIIFGHTNLTTENVHELTNTINRIVAFVWSSWPHVLRSVSTALWFLK